MTSPPPPHPAHINTVWHVVCVWVWCGYRSAWPGPSGLYCYTTVACGRSAMWTAICLRGTVTPSRCVRRGAQRCESYQRGLAHQNAPHWNQESWITSCWSSWVSSSDSIVFYTKTKIWLLLYTEPLEDGGTFWKYVFENKPLCSKIYRSALWNPKF